MAEVVFGAVASGIAVGALVAQVTSSIAKLKSYWDQVQDAPRGVQDVSEEVETLRHLFAAVEDNQRRNVALGLDPSHMLMCLRFCNEEVARLEDFNESLNTHQDAKCKMKRIWASTKVLMEKEMLKRCKMRFKRAFGLLCVSQQAYSIGVQYSVTEDPFYSQDLTASSSRAGCLRQGGAVEPNACRYFGYNPVNGTKDGRSGSGRETARLSF